jgi:hypothetical protein
MDCTFCFSEGKKDCLNKNEPKMDALWTFVCARRASRMEVRLNGVVHRSRRATRRNGEFTKAELVAILTAITKATPSSQYTRADLIRANALMKGVISLQRRYRSRARNRDCPITLEKLAPPVFKHVSAAGYVRGYSLEPLMQYIVSVGKALDPVTRVDFNAVELKRMDQMAREHKIECKSVYGVIFDPEERKRYMAARAYADTMDMLEWDICDTFDILVEIVGSYAEHEAEAFVIAVTTAPREFKRFHDSLFTVAILEPERATNIIQQLCTQLADSPLSAGGKASLLELINMLKEAIASITSPPPPAAAHQEQADDEPATPPPTPLSSSPAVEHEMNAIIHASIEIEPGVVIEESETSFQDDDDGSSSRNVEWIIDFTRMSSIHPDAPDALYESIAGDDDDDDDYDDDDEYYEGDEGDDSGSEHDYDDDDSEDDDVEPAEPPPPPPRARRGGRRRAIAAPAGARRLAREEAKRIDNFGGHNLRPRRRR